MKSSTNLTRLLTGIFIIATLFVSCKKETSQVSQQGDADFATATTTSNIEADVVFDDVFNNVMGVNEEVAFGGTGVFGRFLSTDSTSNPCFTVQVIRMNAPEKFPVKIIIDFGTGCKGRDEITRKGKIITVYTGRLAVPGKVAETTFDGYYINDFHVEGSHRIENTSTLQGFSFKVNITNGKITIPNGNFSQRTSVYTITQTEGSDTPFWLKDDVISIRGEATGTIKKDNKFFIWTSKTLEPLIKRFTCAWIVKGRVGIGKTNTDAVIIDYGDGTCDKKATIIINGTTTEISLH